MIDLSKFNSLLGNDKQVICRFLNLYCEHMPKQLTRLGQQLNEHDNESASITAHEIKSQSAYLGLDKIVELSALIEKQTEENNTSTTSQLFLELSLNVNKTIPHLQDMM